MLNDDPSMSLLVLPSSVGVAIEEVRPWERSWVEIGFFGSWIAICFALVVLAGFDCGLRLGSSSEQLQSELKLGLVPIWVCVSHPVAKCKLVIGKVPHKDDLDAATTRTDINTETGKSIQTTSEGDRTPSHHSTVPRQVTSWANAFGDSGDEPEDDDFVNDFGEDEWPPLQGEGSSKPSNELDDTPYTGQQSNIMAMVPFQSFGAITTTQRNLNLVALQLNVSKPLIRIYGIWLKTESTKKICPENSSNRIILVMPSRHGLSRTTNPLRLADSASGLALGGDVLERLVDMLNMGT
ncbi:hypothetical protein FNV43_RR03619 [Rhamnella rubrinervis]|uniref:Uncharacterized protein n=1 Tax=Rhamnella rubrinervis TaxID=2594499 RepID=A0A8K0HI18_9ROSA|nr:hypothetical protein FNV43_RR03619 [Rhamnella rubrinervis]